MTREIQVQLRSTVPGCFTDAQWDALKRAFFVMIEDQVAGGDSGNSVSQDLLNLASLDQRGDVFVPSVMTWQKQLMWFPDTTEELVFDGWRAEMDPTSAYTTFAAYPIQANADAGTSVKGEPSGTVKVHPSLEISLVTSTEIRVKLRNAKVNTPVWVRLIQHPIPPQKP